MKLSNNIKIYQVWPDIAKNNFKQKLDNKEYVEALNLIENNIGKGRFSQRISQSNFIESNNIPVYIKKAINKIYGMVRKIYEWLF